MRRDGVNIWEASLWDTGSVVVLSFPPHTGSTVAATFQTVMRMLSRLSSRLESTDLDTNFK